MTANKPSRLVPKLRFPEFRDAVSWDETPLGKIMIPVVREREKPAAQYTGLGIRSHGKGTFRKEREQPEKISMDRLFEVRANDLIVNITFAWEGAIAIARPDDSGTLVSHRFPTYEFDQNIAVPEFFRYPMLDHRFIYSLGVISPGGAGRNRVLNKTDFLKIKIALPKVAEQKKIADCMGSLDELIEAESRKLVGLRRYKVGLMEDLFPQPGDDLPRRRFPDFQGQRVWNQAKLGDLVDTVAPPKKLSTSEYLTIGRFPIVDQSQREISGWTNDENAIVASPQPLIVFGDHTCALKLVSRPFAQGADGIKILRPRRSITAAFLFQYLNCRPLVTEKYKRHFSDLKEKEVSFPNRDSGEQQRIADCLANLDEKIEAQADKIELLNLHKRGLLQQLFPDLEHVN